MSADSPFNPDPEDDSSDAASSGEWSDVGEIPPTPFGVLNFHIVEVKHMEKHAKFIVKVQCDQHPFTTAEKLDLWVDVNRLRTMADALGVETRMRGTKLQVRGDLAAFVNKPGKGVFSDYLHTKSGERRGQFALGLPAPKSSEGFDAWAAEQNDGAGLTEDQQQAIKQSAAGIIKPEHAELFD